MHFKVENSTILGKTKTFFFKYETISPTFLCQHGPVFVSIHVPRQGFLSPFSSNVSPPPTVPFARAMLSTSAERVSRMCTLALARVQAIWEFTSAQFENWPPFEKFNRDYFSFARKEKMLINISNFALAENRVSAEKPRHWVKQQTNKQANVLRPFSLNF